MTIGSLSSHRYRYHTPLSSSFDLDHNQIHRQQYRCLDPFPLLERPLQKSCVHHHLFRFQLEMVWERFYLLLRNSKWISFADGS